MQMLRAIKAIAFVYCFGALQPALHAQPAVVTGLKDLAAGNQMPQTLKLKELKGEWQRFEASLQTSVQNQMIAAMSGAQAGDGDTFYTQGQTVTLGNASFLVAYRAQLRRPNFMDMMAGQQGRKLQSDALTPDTGLTLALLSFQHIGALMNLKTFDLATEIATSQKQAAAINNDPVLAQARGRAESEGSRSNLKQLGLAIIQYAQDNKDALPPMLKLADLKKALLPYLKTEALLQHPVTNEPHLANGFLDGRKWADILLNPRGDTLQMTEVVMMYEASPAADGGRSVLFMDGRVKQLSQQEWDEAKVKSRIP